MKVYALGCLPGSKLSLSEVDRMGVRPPQPWPDGFRRARNAAMAALGSSVL
jgi:hypothetical protein